MEQSQKAVPFAVEEMEETQNAVPFTVEEMEETQNAVPFTIEEMEQKSLQCGEKSSNNGNCEEHSEEQEKHKASEINVEDVDVSRKEPLNSNGNVVPVTLEGLTQEPVDDVHSMENAVDSENEEGNKEGVINDLEMEYMEIKPEIMDYMPEDLKPEIDSSNETESREQSLGKDSEDSKNEIKCLVNVIYKCPTCSEVFSWNESQQQHKCATPYRCQICMKVLTSKAELRSHMSSHNKEPCRICGKTFSNKSYYLAHLRAHSGIGYKCVDCDKVYASSALYTIHRRRHTGDQPYICEFCGKTFVLIRDYQMHIKQHTGETSFECPTCLKRFAIKTTLQNHIRIHTGERPYICEVCGNCFRDPAGLWRHTKAVHGPKKFKCHLCPRKYTESSELKTHLGIHNGERPYECHLCGKKFIFKNCFTKHVKFHEGKSFDCAICMRTFLSASLRDRHVKTHTEEKPYSCANCDKAFSQRRDLIKHVLKFQH